MPDSVPPALASKVKDVCGLLPQGTAWAVLPKGSCADLVQTIGDEPYTLVCSGTMREVEKFMDGLMYWESKGRV